mgnify:CR=1 FL=1
MIVRFDLESFAASVTRSDAENRLTSNCGFDVRPLLGERAGVRADVHDILFFEFSP